MGEVKKLVKSADGIKLIIANSDVFCAHFLSFLCPSKPLTFRFFTLPFPSHLPSLYRLPSPPTSSIPLVPLLSPSPLIHSPSRLDLTGFESLDSAFDQIDSAIARIKKFILTHTGLVEHSMWMELLSLRL